MQQATAQCFTTDEDRLWSGLCFEKLSEEELALQQALSNEPTHQHEGVWWLESRRMFCTACNPLAEVDHRVSQPLKSRALLGYLHLSAPGSPSNTTYKAIVREDIPHYSLSNLSRNRRATVRKALTRLAVRPVERLDDLLQDGYEVYVSWHDRVRWGRNKTNRLAYARWITRAFQMPKRIVLGAYAGDILVSFMLPFSIGHIVSPAFIASRSDYLHCSPNDCLFHAFLCIARQTPGIDVAYFGPVASKESLNQFKLEYGRAKTYPAFRSVNVAMRTVFAPWLRKRYPWLLGEEAPETHFDSQADQV